jgi:hypothetical protein
LNDRGEVLYKDNVMVEFETEKEAEEFIRKVDDQHNNSVL